MGIFSTGARKRAGEDGLWGQEKQWKDEGPERAQAEGSRKRGFVERWTSRGDEDQGTDGMGGGDSKVTSEVTMGTVPRDGEIKLQEGPPKRSQRKSRPLRTVDG